MPAYKRINQNLNTSSNSYRTFHEIRNVEAFEKANSIQQSSEPQPQPQEQFKHLQNTNLPSENNQLQQQIKQQQQERDEQINNIPKNNYEQKNVVQPRNTHDPNTEFYKKTNAQIEQEVRDKMEKEKQNIRQEMEREIRNKMRQEMEKEKQTIRENMEHEMKKKVQGEIETKIGDFNNKVERMRHELKETYDKQSKQQQQQRMEFNKNITIKDITEKYGGSNNVDGYHLLEVNRLLQGTPSLNFEQARSIANINGCNEDGSTSVCPSKKIEHFQEKGNCVGGKCKVSFSDPKEKEDKKETFNQGSPADKIKKLNIDFYSNQRCGFCHRSTDLFKREGVLQHITVKNNAPLPKGVEGYPHFVSKTTGKSHTGAPSSVEALINRLS